jgi:hypothetical protein
MHIIGTLNLIAIKFYIVYQYGYECDDEAPEKSSSIRPGVVTPGLSGSLPRKQDPYVHRD